MRDQLRSVGTKKTPVRDTLKEKSLKSDWGCTEKEFLHRYGSDLAENKLLLDLYESYKRELEEVTARYFGNGELSKRAVFDVLVAVTVKVKLHDMESTHTVEWIRQCADSEARRLRMVLDSRFVGLGDWQHIVTNQ